jgi:hypothetical protein
LLRQPGARERFLAECLIYLRERAEAAEGGPVIPLPTRALTIAEKYAVLAALHAAVCHTSEKMNPAPWRESLPEPDGMPGSELYGMAVRWEALLSNAGAPRPNGEQNPEWCQLPEKDRPAVESFLQDVAEDLRRHPGTAPASVLSIRSSPVPELSVADYDEILNVIQSMAMVYERNPAVFAGMEEEHLRTILLVGLNGRFKGEATGETFNGEGKSDILIRVKDNNVFIAECLFWDGPEKFERKLTEQLFRYSTWRDSKLAAIVFNRKKDFSAVVQKMKEVVAGLEHRLEALPFPSDTGCRYRFRRADDPQKEFILSCLAFEVPS